MSLDKEKSIAILHLFGSRPHLSPLALPPAYTLLTPLALQPAYTLLTPLALQPAYTLLTPLGPHCLITTVLQEKDLK